MNLQGTSRKDTLSSRDFYRMIRPEEYDELGIDPSDIPLGTFPALKHPSQLPSTYGGNAYGFGIFESHDRLSQTDIKFIQSISFDNPDEVRHHYRDLNELYRKTGILIRISSKGRPYYLIPIHLVSSSLSHIQSKLNEIAKIITFHKKKYLKEQYDIGLVAQQDDFVVRELSLRFKEHRFFVLNSLKSLTALEQPLDLVILTQDILAFILTEIALSPPKKELNRSRLNQYALHMLWKIYGLLAPEGELFVIAARYSPKINRTSKVIFKSVLERKNFALFTHLFKTKKRYPSIRPSIQANLFDFQKYLGGVSARPEVISKLLGGRDLGAMTIEGIQHLPYLDISLEESRFFRDQEKAWSQLLSRFFDKIFLKPLTPQAVIREWQERFSCVDYTPHYMLIYLGQKKTYPASVDKVREDVLNSSLAGCQLPFLAEYRDTFGYVIRTLQVVNELKTGYGETFPQILRDRLIQPLHNKRRRFIALNHIMKLVSKISRLQEIENYLNPDRLEGPRTRILTNLAVFPFFGFSEHDIREIILIVIGHSIMGRIIAGKLNERNLKSLSDLARRYDRQQALNLLRYCRLMTVAETVAAKGAPITTERLIELFDIYETTFRVVTNRDLDWDVLMDEKMNSAGGIRDMLIQRILMMTNHFEFLHNWSELLQKGKMEKEALADYDAKKLARIEDVIGLVGAVDYFENSFFHSDPLQLPAFCRKFLDMEFHGTSRLFEKMESRTVFILLWITVNVIRGEVINFNPVLADVEEGFLDARLRELENEARNINTQYLDLPALEQLSSQLYHHGSAFIVGTGFQLRTNHTTGALDVGYVDLERDIRSLEFLIRDLEGKASPEISPAALADLEALFSHLESFYQSHLRLLEQLGADSRLPTKQKKWYQDVCRIREELLIDFRKLLFDPAGFFTDISRFFSHAPTLTGFLLPELTALRGVNVSGRLYLKSSIIDYILATARKMQALVLRDRKGFQDLGLLHRLAQREFGPMAAGIIGVNESQINQLEQIVEQLRGNPSLFHALIRSFLFQDIGRVQLLREKYVTQYDPADFSAAGAFFLQKEGIAGQYGLDRESERLLVFLVRNHSVLHHIVRGEMAFDALQDILSQESKDLFDAFFVFSFVMLSALREDLMLEDLAGRLFEIRGMCLGVLDGKTTFQKEMDTMYKERGDLYHGLVDFQIKGLPPGVSTTEYIASRAWKRSTADEKTASGQMIFALERLLRLRGIRYVEFNDLFQCILKVPLKFIYAKRHLSSIGYATYEKELFEALRLYNSLQNLGESVRHFILDLLINDQVHIYGYEKISGYLNYENQIKLLLIGLLATKELNPLGSPITIDFLPMDEDIHSRYEAVNDFLNRLPIERIWGPGHRITQFFNARTGILMKSQWNQKVISVSFKDHIHFDEKVDHINTINDVQELKNYFHYSLQSLRKFSFHTDDHEAHLEKAYEERLKQIAELTLIQTKKQMALIDTFEELHRLVNDLESRSLELGFTAEQTHRLKDLYELRKDVLKRDKLREIEKTLDAALDNHELNDYWNSTKWFLLHNRIFLGKDFEFIVARKFDEAFKRNARS
jgi:hypothetical protein